MVTNKRIFNKSHTQENVTAFYYFCTPDQQSCFIVQNLFRYSFKNHWYKWIPHKQYHTTPMGPCSVSSQPRCCLCGFKGISGLDGVRDLGFLVKGCYLCGLIVVHPHRLTLVKFPHKKLVYHSFVENYILLHWHICIILFCLGWITANLLITLIYNIINHRNGIIKWRKFEQSLWLSWLFHGRK